jgi:glycosyltransferase involved in cell wall biosynthesis
MVTIITITYNRAHLIGETIESVLSQSYRDFEYLIIDDGSDDNTEHVIKAFNDPRIIYKRYDHSGKIAMLRNKAMESASGNFIAFIDSDDIWMTDKMQLQIESLTSNRADFSFCEAEIFTSKGTVFTSLYDKHNLQRKKNFFLPLIADVRFVLFPSSILFKTSCICKTGYMNEKYTSGDKEFLCRLALNFNGSFVNQKLGEDTKA